ncbi:MAG: MFS transporter [Candidatus Baltobacteraceae bacterium]
MAFALTASRNGAAVRAPATPSDGNVVEFGARRAIVALPNIQGNFGASVSEAAWIGTGYIIANVVVIPLTPWLQMRFGRRQYYAASIALFTLASLMCGLAGSLGALIVWRVVQGLGGGGLISTSQAILRETFPDNEQGKAAGIFSMGVIVGPTLGPMLGGIVTDNLSWRWAFFINLPLGLLALGLVLSYLRNPRAPRRMRLDVRGLALLALGIGSLQYALDRGQQRIGLTIARSSRARFRQCWGSLRSSFGNFAARDPWWTCTSYATARSPRAARSVWS